MAYVFRRPWREWRRDKPKSTFVLPPPAAQAQRVDQSAYGQMRIVTLGWSSKPGVTFRRPWGPWGGLRFKGYALRTNTAEVTDNNSAKWYRQFTDPPAYLRKRELPAALHPHFGFTQAATQMGGSFGEEVFVSSWYPPLSQPIIVHRDRRRIPTAVLPFAFRPAWPDISIAWFDALTEPTRFKPGFGKVLQPGSQQALAWFNHTEINLGWYRQLNQPAFQHPDLRRKYTTAHHQFEFREPEIRDVRIAWFLGMNLPPSRFARPYLPPALHIFYASNPGEAPGRPFAKGYIIL